MTTIKLILSYHKPDVLLKDDVLTPINAGRAASRALLDADDPNLRWLVENTLGDDTGDNISLKNSRYNEMTSVYWAWKNYDTLGNPDYVGFMHYRRHFQFSDGPHAQLEVTSLGTDDYLAGTLGYSPEKLVEIVSSCDLVYTRPLHRESMFEHYRQNHRVEDLHLAMAILRERFPDYAAAADEYLAGSQAIFCNMFIMPKELFFEYAEFMFGILLEMEVRADLQDRRMFVSEWLTGIFITAQLSRGANARTLPMVIAEGRHSVPVVVAASPSFVQPMSVTLTSLLENAGPNTSYHIYILVSEKYDPNVEAKILSLVGRYPGTEIHFVSIGNAFDEVEVSTDHLRVHTYFRLLIPSTLPQLARCIYLDSDVVVERDLTPLLRTVVDDKYIAGVHAAGYRTRTKEQAASAGLPSYENYVNAGVLLMNLDRMRKHGLEDRFMELAMRDLESDDQDVLNIACYDGIRILPLRFNLMTKYLPANKDEFFAYSGVPVTWSESEWSEAVRAPVVIHYADRRKPWADASVDFAERWWRYAMRSPFRDEIIGDHLDAAMTNAQEKIGYYRRTLVKSRAGRRRAERQVASLLQQPAVQELKKFREAVVAAARLDRALRDEKDRHAATKRLLKSVTGSYSFKVGRLLTSAPRKLRALVRAEAPVKATPPTATGAPASTPSPDRGSAGPQRQPERAASRRPEPAPLRKVLARVLPSSREQANRIARKQSALVKREQQKVATRQWRIEKSLASLERDVLDIRASLNDLAESRLQPTGVERRD